MSQLSYKSRLLSRVPGFARLYATIARLDDERIAAINANKATQATLSQMQALETLQAVTAHERDEALASLTVVQQELSATSSRLQALETLQSATAHERDQAVAAALVGVQSERALSAQLDQTLASTTNTILQRINGLQDANAASAANVMAVVQSITARHDAAVWSLRRQMSGSSKGSDAGADLYLDLLEASLTGMIGEDPSDSPWTAPKFDAALRSVGRDWPTSAVTMIGTARMRNLRMLLLQAIHDGIEGDFIETGVWRGGACIYAKGILRAMGEKDRRVFVADSFKGLPPPDPQQYPADAGDVHHEYEQLAISRHAVEDNFRRYGLLDDQVVFLEGWFKDTLPVAPIEKLAVLRLDGDMYESTIQTLDALYHKVSPGGYVIIDDYILKPCAHAVDEFRKAHGIAAPLNVVDTAAVWWQV